MHRGIQVSSDEYFSDGQTCFKTHKQTLTYDSKNKFSSNVTCKPLKTSYACWSITHLTNAMCRSMCVFVCVCVCVCVCVNMHAQDLIIHRHMQSLVTPPSSQERTTRTPPAASSAFQQEMTRNQTVT